MSRSLEPSSPAVSAAGRAVHDLGLAALLGGTLFGRVAMHPAVASVSDARERGQVVNDAWRRYGAVNGAALAAVAGGWTAARAGDAADRRLTARERRLARAKDVLVGAVGVTGLATAAEGVWFSRQAPGGAVPLTDGDTAAPEASARQTRTKRVLQSLGRATLVAEAGLVVVNAALAQEGFRRPGVRRRLRR